MDSSGLQLAILCTPFLQGIFDVTGPGFDDRGIALLFTTIEFGTLEAGKYVASRMREQAGKA